MWNRFSLWFDKVSLLKKVILVPIVSMILSAIMITINYNTSNSIASNSENLYKKLIPLSEYSVSNKFLLNNIVENFANGVLSSEKIFFTQATNQANQIRRNFLAIENSELNLKNTKKAIESFERYYKIAFKTTTIMLNSSKDISQLKELDELYESLNQTKFAFEELDKEIKDSINSNFLNIENTIEVIVHNELYTIAFMYFMLFILTFIIYQNINKRFKSLIEDIVTLSKSSFESKKRIEKVSNDELGILTSSLNNILENYENNVDKLNEEKMKYFDLSHKDKLTGLFNRHYLDSILLNYEDKSYRGFLYGIIIIDIDDFKQINDTYGHQVGDEVLKITAKTLENNIRKIDIIGRWGGEEFICLVEVNNKQSLLQIAENLRLTIERTKIPIINNLTISLGCSLNLSEKESFKLIENADEALYKAKRFGKNRVEYFEN